MGEPTKFALRRVRVLDGRGGRLERQTILIDGSRIRAVGPSRITTVPRGYTDLDVGGLTVLPGLIDCHVHLCLGAEPDVVDALERETPSETLLKASQMARQTIDAGFTTVRDVGARDHSIFSLKRAIEKGLTRGPRIVGAGLAICMIGGHARFIGREIEGPDQAREVVRAQIAAGAEVIKVIASGGVLTPGTSPDQAQLTDDELAAAVDEAGRAGRKVAAHAHGATGIKNAVRAGVHSIEHATLMDDESATLMGRHGVYMVPTLSALATTAACRRGCGIPESALDKAKAMTKRHQVSFREAHRRQLPIAMGTDAGTPFNVHGENAQELERMVALGMSPMEAIVSATTKAADLIGLADVIGSVEPGKEADLLVIDGDPSKKVAYVRDRARLLAVIQRGRVVSGALAER
ncbi:amidohydrolase [Nitrospira sp.]|nr:amidohydrolase [Nitrospira sp.]